MTDRYASLKQGLVGCWIPSVSGSGLLLPDLSGRGNNGSLVGMDASDWVSASYGRALDFDGVNDKVTLSMQNTASLTASCWVYSRNINNANGEYFVVKWGPNPSVNANDFYIGAFSNNWIARSGDGATGQSTLLQTPATANQWTHLLITRDAVNLRLFVNGIQMTSTSAVGFQGGGSRPLELCDLAGFPANCQLDDVRLYSRALTEPEIKLLASEPGIGFKPAKKLSRFSQRFTYSPPKARNYGVVRVKETDYATLRQGLVGAWCPSLPNGGSGNTLPDQSGYNNHGSLVNMSPDDWVAGQYGRALDFDGSNDEIDYGTNVSLAGEKRVSFSAWIYRATQGQVFALSRYNTNLSAGNVRGDLFGTNNITLNGQVVLAIQNSSTVNDYLDFYSTQQVPASQWTHIAATAFIDGNNSTCNMWINGVAATVNSNHNGTRPTAWQANSSVSYRTSRVIISNGSSLYSSGIIDDLRTYNRALTEPEIKLLASRPGIGLRQDRDRNTFYQFPSGARRKRILTGMP